MCPDDQILSAFYDGEVPEPWNTKISEHVRSCPECGRRIEKYDTLSSGLKSEPDGFDRMAEFSQERIYRNLISSNGRVQAHLWQKNISVPLPFIAAAAAVILFFGIGYFTGRAGLGNSPEPLPLAREDSSEVLTVQLDDGDMTDLAELLRNRDEQVQVFIELPPASFFDAGEEPQLIRAADYRP